MKPFWGNEEFRCAAMRAATRRNTQHVDEQQQYDAGVVQWMSSSSNLQVCCNAGCNRQHVWLKQAASVLQCKKDVMPQHDVRTVHELQPHAAT
ncbi:hypothetical protein HaLaN_19959, partial [Haematococcus lacustris]